MTVNMPVRTLQVDSSAFVQMVIGGLAQLALVSLVGAFGYITYNILKLKNCFLFAHVLSHSLMAFFCMLCDAYMYKYSKHLENKHWYHGKAVGYLCKAFGPFVTYSLLINYALVFKNNLEHFKVCVYLNNPLFQERYFLNFSWHNLHINTGIVCSVAKITYPSHCTYWQWV